MGTVPVGTEGDRLELRIRASSENQLPIERVFHLEILNQAPNPEIYINEFLAANRTGISDQSGVRRDWIEIYNPGPDSIQLSNYALSDDPRWLSKWVFPNVTLPSNRYQLVFASGADESNPAPPSELHANFRLNADGEFLALSKLSGSVLQEFSPRYPEQLPDVSFGRHTNQQQVYFPRPTPKAANSTITTKGKVPLPRFSHKRGFYSQAILLRLAPQLSGASIRYTIDGTLPTESIGMRYQNPINIATTTILKVISFHPGFLPSAVETHSYIFPDSVARQPSNPEGYPSDWGTDNEVPGRTVVSDYEMDPRVVDAAQEGFTVPDALEDIPTLSISMPVSDLFGSRGIYTHPLSRGDAWERDCSLEWMDPSGTDGFQVNSQIEMHGNSSRRPWRMQKHSFRLTFLSRLGTGKLNFPLFKDSPVKRFNKLILRACFTDSWGLVSWAPNRYRPNDSQYIRDIWMKESMAAMGHSSSHGDWVHLYLNGLYWGIYNITERLDEDFFADHLGGQPEDWEIAANFSGSSPGWSRLLSELRSLSADDDLVNIEKILDVDNFIDYFLLHFYADAEDWPHQNGYAARNRSAEEPFRFYVWDQEIALDNHRMQRYSSGASGKPGEMFQRLRRNDVFRRRFADRVQHHLFERGGLRLKDAQERYLQIANRIDKAIVAESARWGDTQASTPYGNRVQQPSRANNVDDLQYPPAPHAPDIYFTREDSWLIERDNVINHYLPAIYDPSHNNSLINELRANRLYPNIAPPLFTPGGGSATAFEIQLNSPAGGEIYFTLNGTDPLRSQTVTTEAHSLLAPREPAYILIATSPTPGREWIQPDYNHVGWPSGPIGIGYETTPAEYVPWIQSNVGAMHDLAPSVYIRIPFNVSASDLEKRATLTLQMQYDDGFVAFLNGTQVAEANAPSSLSWNSTATSSHSDSEAVIPENFDLTQHKALLKPGENLLAIQGLNTTVNSTDLLIRPQLILREQSSDGSEGSGRGMLYTAPITLTKPTQLSARAFHNNEWSPLATATYFVGSPAARGNLVISEIYYHPDGSPDSEFIRLQNIHPSHALDLSGVSVTRGVQFVFPRPQSLGPRESAVLVRSRDQFKTTFGDQISILGEYAGALNNGGESIEIQDANGNMIAFVTYGDSHPWPSTADGQGKSLALRTPFQAPATTSADHWTAQTPLEPLPSANPPTTRPTNPTEDLDQDGLTALLEYALGSSDSDPKSGAELIRYRIDTFPQDASKQSHFVIQHHVNPVADDTTITPQLSNKLGPSQWSNHGFIEFDAEGAEPNWKSYRTAQPIHPESSAFIRLSVE